MENIEKLEQESTEIVLKVNEWKVVNREQYDGLNIFMAGVRRLKKNIKATFDPIVQKAKATHSEACSQRKKHLDPVLEAEKIGNSKMIDYDTEQERVRKKKEEQLRLAAEREEHRKKEALEARAQKAEEKGNAEKAEELRAKKEDVVVEAPVLAEPEKAKDVSYSEKWYADDVDNTLLSREFLVPDMVMLNRMAGVYKDTKKIPGVTFKMKKILTRRT